ncbi:MAG: hypothetical protein V1888_03015 [archaeon]
MITGYCMKCGKENKEKGKNIPMKDAQMTMTSRGGFMAKGKCSKCGCGMCAIMSKDNAEKALAAGDAKKTY